MAAISAWPRNRGIVGTVNMWTGSSTSTQGTTRRIVSLFKIGNEPTLRFLSVEPQFEEIELASWLPRLDRVRQGGTSGGKNCPIDIGRASAPIGQCHEYGIPPFFKQSRVRCPALLQAIRIRVRRSGKADR
jgi:protein gp37